MCQKYDINFFREVVSRKSKGIALVDADTREAVAIRAVQKIMHQLRKWRRPNCVKQIEKDSLLTHYLLALHDHKKQLLKLSNIVVADAFFSKKTFVKGLSIMDFELVSRFRDDVRLRYLYTGEKTGKKGHPVWRSGTIRKHSALLKAYKGNIIVWNLPIMVHLSSLSLRWEPYRSPLSIADLKLLMHNAMMIERFLSMFGKLPNLHKNQGLKEHYFKELMLYGLKAAD